MNSLYFLHYTVCVHSTTKHLPQACLCSRLPLFICHCLDGWSLFCLPSKLEILSLSCLTWGDWFIHHLFMTLTAGVLVHRGKSIFQDAPRARPMNTCINKNVHWYNLKKLSLRGRCTTVYKTKNFTCMYTFRRIYSLLLAATQQSLPSKQHKYFHVLSNEKADTLLTTSACSSPWGWSRSTPTSRSSAARHSNNLQHINSSGPNTNARAKASASDDPHDL